MSAPVRFLVVAVAGWAALRFVTLGDVTGFTVSYAKQPPAGGLPPIAATEFPPLPPVTSPPQPQFALAPFYSPYPAWPDVARSAFARYLPYPYAVPA